MSVWTPSPDAQRVCQHCGAHVDAKWRRCYGRDGVAHACVSCAATYVDALRGASDPEWEPGTYDSQAIAGTVVESENL